MEAKHAIVIDKIGYKVEFVLVSFKEENGAVKEQPQYYALLEGESLVYEDVPLALHMLKPRWNGSTWEETASPDEIEAARPESIPPHPSEMDIVLLAIAEIYEKMSGGAA